jgi:hypothetical protein
MSSITIIVRKAGYRTRGPLYDAHIEGRQEVLCRSHQPFLEAARRLGSVAIANPDTRLVMRHEGSDVVALHGRLAEAVKWTISERDGRLRLDRWQPSQLEEVLAG